MYCIGLGTYSTIIILPHKYLSLKNSSKTLFLLSIIVCHLSFNFPFNDLYSDSSTPISTSMFPTITLYDFDGKIMANNDTLIVEASWKDWEDPGYKAVDGTTDLTEQVIISGDSVIFDQLGIYKIIYTVSASNGLTTKATRYIQLIDTTPPFIYLGDDLDAFPCHLTFDRYHVGVTDIVDKDLTNQIEITFAIACEVEGEQLFFSVDSIPKCVTGSLYINFRVFDSSGNVAQKNKYYRLYDTDSSCLDWCTYFDQNIDNFCQVTGIETQQLQTSVIIAPNPSTGLLRLTIPTNIETYHLHLYDITGKLVYANSSINQSSISIDLTNQSAGIYLFDITTSKGAIVKKVVLEK